MSRKRNIVHTLKKASEVRHLLLDVTAGAGAAKLSKLVKSVETAIDTGTQYEMEQQAHVLAKDWIDNEGFRFRLEENEHVFDSLENTLALVTYLGFKYVQDARYQNFTPGQRPNLGICPLDQWPGMKPKDYMYAFNGAMIILAAPRDASGRPVEFILGGDNGW